MPRGFLDENGQRASVVEIAAEIKRETEKAWLLYDGAREAWVPKSQADSNGDGTFMLPEWLAKDKGFL